MPRREKIKQYIKEMNSISENLNELLIIKLDLESLPALSEVDRFELPIRAAKKSLIERTGEIQICKEYSVEYSLHGTGISFSYQDFRIGFNYYPKIESGRKPIFSLINLFEYIESTEGELSRSQKNEIDNILSELRTENSVFFPYFGFSSFYLK